MARPAIGDVELHMNRESDNAAGPLVGYRVIDLADESGTYGTKILADLGADVLKVEPPGGHRTRRLPPFFRDQSGAEHSLFFAYMETNKRSVTLDLDTRAGQGLLRHLVNTADVVFETSPYGYLTERGIGYEAMSRENEKLVWTAITAFGQTGPRRHWKGSDLVAWAASGALWAIGEPDRAPVVPGSGLGLAYAMAAVAAASGTLLALRARQRWGRGQVVDISLQEAMVAGTRGKGVPTFLDSLVQPVRLSTWRGGRSVPSGMFPCQDGYVSVFASQANHWRAMAAWIHERLGIDAALDPIFHTNDDRAQARELVEEWVEDLTRLYPMQTLFLEGQRRGIPIAPINPVSTISQDPHLQARDYWAEVSHPVLGTMRLAGAPYRLSRTPWRTGRAPLLGEHNDQVYGRELGLTASALDALRAEGAI
ncbi:MAG: CoA transferase [Chloroflexi bacterium]|nr:CoA transferase [Chloroflexota bacterium]